MDRVAEEALLVALGHHLPDEPLLLVAEGLPDTGDGHGVRRLGPGRPRWRLVVDPLDGTRPLAYQKRSAWVLLGLAPEPADGRVPTLTEVVVAAMVEVPPLKQTWADVAWAVRGGGTRGRRLDLRGTEPEQPLVLRPSGATGLAQGYAQVCRAFPGGRAELAAVDDAVAVRLLGPPVAGKAQYFEDQQVSGASLYSLAGGADRVTADLRPLVPGVGHLRPPLRPVRGARRAGGGGGGDGPGRLPAGPAAHRGRRRRLGRVRQPRPAAAGGTGAPRRAPRARAAAGLTCPGLTASR